MTVRIGLAGAGLIGRRHAEALAAAEGVALAAVADPGPAGAAVAARHGVPAFATLDAMLAAGGIDGVILATPNAVHVEGALACIAAGLPVLVEKPLAPDVAGAARIVGAARAAGVAVAVGHHRRHSGAVARAKAAIEAGALGRLTLAHAATWFRKPDAYFDTAWRREAGGGPVNLNLVHDIDMLRHLCGKVISVQAHLSGAARGFAVEDTGAVLLRFASGALGTMSVSDATVAPWSWEMTAGENPAFPATGEGCYWIGGTAGSLALPNLALWRHEGDGWESPIAASRLPHGGEVPLVAQACQFGAVIRDGVAPLVSAAEGLANQRVIAAIRASAETGRPVDPGA